MQLTGIDVSRYQGEIDWQAVASDGVAFAMIKALQGAKLIDKRFAQNAAGAASAGIPFGVYVYSKARNAEEASAEAEAALALTNGLELSYPIAIDVESAHFLDMEEEERGEAITAFCSAVRAAGRIPMLYSNKDWLTNHIPKACSESVPVWLAQWRKTKPDYSGPYAMWQYGRAGVAGISGKVDMDICYVDFPSLALEARPVRFAVTSPLQRGEPFLLMQRALNAARYTDSNGDPLEADGVWGGKSQSALDKLVRSQRE